MSRAPNADATRTDDFDLFGSAARARNEAAGLILLYAPNPSSVPHVVPLSETDPLVVGREPPPGGLAVPHSGVSRVHARIHRAQGGWTVTDLDSRNGTLVNGTKIRQRDLEELDQLRFGDAIYELITHGLERYAGHRIDRPVTAEDAVVGPRLCAVLDGLAAVARSRLPVLLLGETGTGKEVAAHSVHTASERRGRFCALNCAALPVQIAESELFGHRRGAFTGADRDKLGLVAAADGGTLFLDEIGELSPEVQAKLLRVLETGELIPLGATATERVDARVVAATNRDLRREVEAGRFRADLMARLQGHVATLPPLAERKEDLVPLVRHFFAKYGRPSAELEPACAVALCHYDWPYNVRELESVVRRACVLLDAAGAPAATPLALSHLPQALDDALKGYGEHAPVDAEPVRSAPPVAEQLRHALTLQRGNVAAVARQLGKDRTQIHRWMRRYGLDPDDFRS